MNCQYQVVFCIVNAGFSDAVMDAARPAGAHGGTVLRAHGTGTPAAEEKFGITVSPDKEIVMIVVSSESTDAVLHALYKEVGLATPGQGIAFTLPIDNVVGLWEDGAEK